MLKGRAWIGLLIGLAGAGLMGWALFTAFSAACLESARAAGLESCSSSPSGWVALAIPGGIVLAVIGMFTGGGFLIFAALFMAVGLSALIPTWLGLMPDMETFGWLFGGIFFLCGLLPLFLGVVGGRMVARKRELAETLYQTGAKGVGTIVEVTDTGMTINDNPHVRIRMRVVPIDGGPPVERSKTVTVSRVAIPRAGERFPVWYDRVDEDKWMFGVDMEPHAPAAVKEMFARARAAGGEAADDATADGADASPVEELARLSLLWKDGALTDAEFAEAKARLLPRIGR